MNPGQLRHTVRIERRSSTQDAAGEQVNSWSLVFHKRAALVRTPGREVFAAAERQGRVPTVFKLRFVEGVLPEMRLIHGGKVFDIVSAIDPTGMRAELHITAEEHVEESAS